MILNFLGYSDFGIVVADGDGCYVSINNQCPVCHDKFILSSSDDLDIAFSHRCNGWVWFHESCTNYESWDFVVKCHKFYAQ